MAVPIVGITDAGGKIIFHSEAQRRETAPLPPNGGRKTVAVKYTSTGLRAPGSNPASGWLVYFDDYRRPPSPATLDRLCVVGLVNGEVVVKWIFKGRGAGLFDLEDTGTPTMRDVEAQWASLVTAMIPADAPIPR
jgi:hypothetical protein